MRDGTEMQFGEQCKSLRIGLLRARNSGFVVFWSRWWDGWEFRNGRVMGFGFLEIALGEKNQDSSGHLWPIYSSYISRYLAL